MTTKYINKDCNYEHGYDIDKGEIIGEKGEFFRLPIEMKQNQSLSIRSYYPDPTAQVLACPKCGIVFIER